MELVIQIIILATAVVGLYKAATFHHSKPAPVQQDGEKPKNVGAFSDFFELIGMFLFMLAFPAFLYAFMWIMSSLPNAISSSSNSDEIPIIEISKDSTAGQVMLVAALNITSSHGKNEQLQNIIKYAMSNSDYETALKAASSITSSHTKNEELKKIIKELSSNKPANNIESTPNNIIQPTPKSDAAD